MSTETEVGTAPTALDDGTPGSTIPDTRARPQDRTTAAPTAPPRPAAPARPAAPTAPAQPGPRTNWLVPLLVLVVGMFMSVLDISIVNVAISTMQNDFGATTDQIQWVSTSYSLAEGVIVPASAWLGARLGLGRTYTFAMVGFAIFSAFCGLAWDINSMIAFRILQAIPGGVIPVVALSMLYKIVPRKSMGAAMGIYGLGIVFAPAIGPTLGGYLVEYVDWRLIFFINVPVAVLGVIGAVFLLPRFRPEPGTKFDLPGFLAIAVGLFSLLLALSEGPKWGWTSYPTLILLTLGVLSLALFVVVELEVDQPMLDVRVFGTWAFSNSLILISIVSVGLFGVLFYIPVYLQQFQNMGAFDTGLLLLPQALVMAVIMPVAGQIYDRIGAKWPAAIGLTIVALTTWDLAGLTPDTPHGKLELILAVRAAGIGLAMMPIMTGGLSALPSDRSSMGSAFNTVVQRASSAIGLAAMTALMTVQQAQESADRSGLMSSSGSASSSASGASASSGGSSAGSAMLEQYQAYQHLQSQVFITGLNDLLIATAILTACAVPLALMLRGGKPPAEDGPRVIEG
ncbi:DHA2 family efflux MFS transporter permease subunit [Actinomycetospora endophytica]|uniref:DHA2 family efflux MFS transporter permease subunit n=1 Tax=Actinomycetospora endophytica TaxID=2291215 RepID=A0ABS8P9C7_9PSEU|nr:DHA2 family efflux MFS transporter permease subunit [Actinomycetospora endophytica]MCD2194882.1 DHA2 family efflux MFS transporter permease subunit [Actinomycetospora endophytica]